VSCWDVGLLDLGMVHMGFICLRLMTQGLVHTGDTLGIWSSIWLWNTFKHYVWVEFSEITISNSYNWSFRAIETDNDWIFLVYLCFGQLVCTTASLCTNLAPSDSINAGKQALRISLHFYYKLKKNAMSLYLFQAIYNSPSIIPSNSISHPSLDPHTKHHPHRSRILLGKPVGAREDARSG